jgi:hypothetical protein
MHQIVGIYGEVVSGSYVGDPGFWMPARKPAKFSEVFRNFPQFFQYKYWDSTLTYEQTAYFRILSSP